MALKPTTDDLIGFLQLQSPPGPDRLAALDEALLTAVEDIESRVVLPVGTTDTNYPQKIRSAILLDASRLQKRASSPEGVAGMSDIGAVVHILGRDSDIERLIARYRKLSGFS